MKFIKPLYKRAKSTLKMMKDRVYNDNDADFLPNESVVTRASSSTPVYESQSEADFLDSLKCTYEDIAESDPEAALDMIKQALADNPPKPLLDALYDIERHIRLQYGSQYFRGKRAHSIR